VAPFAVMNRVVNPVVRALLASPLHPLLDRRLLVIALTGRRSGRPVVLPVGYRGEAGALWIRVGWPDRKRWWRNLQGEGAPVRVLLRGRWRAGHGVVVREGGEVRVRVRPAP
jgi:hypothetical protein